MKIEMTKSFQKALGKIKKDKGLKEIGEIALFKDSKIHDYFEILETYSIYKVPQFKLGKWYNYSELEGSKSSYQFRVIYRGKRIAAIQKILK